MSKAGKGAGALDAEGRPPAPPPAAPNRVVVFVDLAYVEALARGPLSDAGKRRDVNPIALVQALLGAERYWRVFVYQALPHVGEPPDPVGVALRARTQARMDGLKAKRDWVIRLGEVVARPGGFLQKEVDVALATDLVRLAWTGQLACAHLVAGDRDFLPAVREARLAGARVHLWHGPAGSYSPELAAACEATQALPADLGG